MDDDIYNETLKILKSKPNSYDIPKYVVQIIHDNDLLNIENVNERAKLFLMALYKMNLRSTTIMKYFKRLKNKLFPGTIIKPDSMAFDRKYTKPMQVRGANLGKIEAFVKYVLYQVAKTDVYKWPIVLACYTGLRLNEVCSVTMKHLTMLKARKQVIPLKRKNNFDWNVLYFETLHTVVDDIINANSVKYNLYTNNLIDSKLFPFTPQALHFKIKRYYLFATRTVAPEGFGLHSIRYYLASMLYQETNKIEIPQAILGHQRMKTTQLYIKPNMEELQYELQDLSNKNSFYSNIKNIINK